MSYEKIRQKSLTGNYFWRILSPPVFANVEDLDSVVAVAVTTLLVPGLASELRRGRDSMEKLKVNKSLM